MRGGVVVNLSRCRCCCRHSRDLRHHCRTNGLSRRVEGVTRRTRLSGYTVELHRSNTLSHRGPRREVWYLWHVNTVAGKNCEMENASRNHKSRDAVDRKMQQVCPGLATQPSNFICFCCWCIVVESMTAQTKWILRCNKKAFVFSSRSLSTPVCLSLFALAVCPS